jgi:hypothetical protein
MEMKRPVIAAAALTLMLTACTPAPGTPSAGETTDAEFLASFGLDDLDAAGIIDHLDRLDPAERPTDLMASVRQDDLVLTDGGQQQVTLDLPEDSSYISVAPYLSQTHDCFNHSLTTCLGELGNETISVKIIDNTSGETLVDEQTETFGNGFAGFWVPGDIHGTIEVRYDGHSGSADFSTTADSATCVTDLQLT